MSFSNLIDNEIKRMHIANHRNLDVWMAHLSPWARDAVEYILEENLTGEWIQRAQALSEDEFCEYTFIAMIAGGNPDPRIAPSLTNVVLGEILLELDQFGGEVA